FRSRSDIRSSPRRCEPAPTGAATGSAARRVPDRYRVVHVFGRSHRAIVYNKVMAADDLLHWRSEFPILANSVYLVSHSLGAMPRRTRDRLAEYADIWATRGVRAWGEGWWELPRTVGDLIGRIIGAGPGEVVMHQNQSIAQATVLSALDWRGPRNGIVTER